MVIDKVRKDKILTQTSYEEENHCILDQDRTEDIILDELREEKLKECILNLSTKNRKAFFPCIW